MGEVVRHRAEPYRRLPGYEGNLPDGKTCGDCVNIYRCNAIFGHQIDDEVCDWVPSRFASRTDP